MDHTILLSRFGFLQYATGDGRPLWSLLGQGNISELVDVRVQLGFIQASFRSLLLGSRIRIGLVEEVVLGS